MLTDLGPVGGVKVLRAGARRCFLPLF